jgi:thiol:disulfide interchange protein
VVAGAAVALLGGIALNLMPCVFPVLSLKLVSLAGIGDRARASAAGLPMPLASS